MEAFVRDRGVVVPERGQRWSAPELFDLVRRDAPEIEAATARDPRRPRAPGNGEAVLEPFAAETVAAMKQTRLRDRGLDQQRPRRRRLRPRAPRASCSHLDLSSRATRCARLKPDPDGLRVVRERWPDAERTSWSWATPGSTAPPPRPAACRSSRTAAPAPRRSSVEVDHRGGDPRGRGHLVAPGPARRRSADRRPSSESSDDA